MPRTGQVPGDFQSDSERAPPVVDIRKADDPVEQGAKDEHLTAMDRIARPCDLEMAIHRFFADTENARRLASRLAAGRPTAALALTPGERRSGLLCARPDQLPRRRARARPAAPG